MNQDTKHTRRNIGCCSSEGAAAARPSAPAAASAAAVLTRHILQDGELVLLILRPSLWWIVFQSLATVAAIAVLMLLAWLWDARLPGSNRSYMDIGLFLILARVLWSVLQWSNRLYILTDLRILRLSGVLSLDIFACPLRKIAGTRVVRSFRERIAGVGSIEIRPADGDCPADWWRTIARPFEVHELIVATINKAKGRGGSPGNPPANHPPVEAQQRIADVVQHPAAQSRRMYRAGA